MLKLAPRRPSSSPAESYSALVKGRLLLWSIALFVVCFALNTRFNHFAWYYHPDEPGKVEQVKEGRWNMHHPLLLLGTTKLAASATHAGSNEQAIVEIGRNVSAAFMAAAVVALSVLAYAWRGWPAAFLTGALLATHHQLYELSHYFKEDSALLFGVALSLLAAWLYSERATLGRAAFLGAACALATSGKYIGAMMLVVAVPALIASKSEKPARMWSVFVAAFLAVLVLVNLPLFCGLGTFRESFGREVSLVVEGQGGATRRVPHAEYWSIFRDNTTPAMWVALGIFLAARWRERRSLRLIEWLIIVLPFAYSIALSFSPKTNDRYFLPATAIFTLFAALAIADLPRKWAIPAAILLFAAQFPSWSASRAGWLGYDLAFQRDDNADLIDFLRTNVPADAVLLKENRIALPDPDRNKHSARAGVIPQKVIGRRYAADFASFDQLAAKGITHVIVSESDYGKFFLGSLHAQKGAETKFETSREFYRRLFDEADRIWERERSTVIYLHPGIRVYRLRSVAGD
jgi:hypothetical protein